MATTINFAGQIHVNVQCFLAREENYKLHFNFQLGDT